jgi:chitin-binding protein
VPFAPSGLTVANITSSSADLSWTAATDNVGVTGYRAYQDGVEVGNPTSTTFSVTGLTSLTPYTFAVAAYDKAGNVSPQSEMVTVTTL